MSFSLVPTDVKSCIADFCLPSKLYREEVRSCWKVIKNLSLVNKELLKICGSKMSTLKRIHELLNKYNHYQSEYENPRIDSKTKREFNFKANPQLYDALQSDSDFNPFRSTFRYYNQDIENDIKEIVKLMPQSVNCIIGQMGNSITGQIRYREKMTPLHAACFNSNVPISIIEFLLENKANPNDFITLSQRPITILQDLRRNKEKLPGDRIPKIEELFRKYGAKA